eukprot:6662-Pleurochrysis_carterae.AAC.1
MGDSHSHISLSPGMGGNPPLPPCQRVLPPPCHPAVPFGILIPLHVLHRLRRFTRALSSR